MCSTVIFPRLVGHKSYRLLESAFSGTGSSINRKTQYLRNAESFSKSWIRSAGSKRIRPNREGQKYGYSSTKWSVYI